MSTQDFPQSAIKAQLVVPAKQDKLFQAWRSLWRAARYDSTDMQTSYSDVTVPPHGDNAAQPRLHIFKGEKNSVVEPICYGTLSEHGRMTPESREARTETSSVGEFGSRGVGINMPSCRSFVLSPQRRQAVERAQFPICPLISSSFTNETTCPNPLQEGQQRSLEALSMQGGSNDLGFGPLYVRCHRIRIL